MVFNDNKHVKKNIMIMISCNVLQDSLISLKYKKYFYRSVAIMFDSAYGDISD